MPYLDQDSEQVLTLHNVEDHEMKELFFELLDYLDMEALRTGRGHNAQAAVALRTKRA